MEELMKLTIHNRDVEFKFKFLSDIIFEQIQGHSFKADSEGDWIIYFYSSYLANSEDYETDLETFISYLDEDPANFYAFIAWYTKIMTNQMKMINQVESDKKKVSKKKKSK